MKVTLEKDYKRYYTLEDMESAKAVIQYEKEDLETAAGWLEYAAIEAIKAIDDTFREVVTAKAHTARNCRAWNAYGDNTYDIDVWIEGLVRTSQGYMELGAYLSDIWQTGGTYYRDHEYIRYFKEA